MRKSSEPVVVNLLGQTDVLPAFVHKRKIAFTFLMVGENSKECFMMCGKYMKFKCQCP